MKVLIAYLCPTISTDYSNKIKYKPDLSCDPVGLQVEIATYKPDTIIVGSNVVSAETLQKWRSIMGDEALLSIIRRGSSMSDIKTEMADSLNISHYRTPSVNAPFVAQYIIQKLCFSDDKRENILSAVIGYGAIGRRIIQRLIREGHTVNVYGPSLANCSSRAEQENIARSKGLLCHERIHFATSPEEAVKNVYYVAIAIDATSVVASGRYLSKEFVLSMSHGTRIVNVSEFHVFTDEAMSCFLKRSKQSELSILFDSHYRDVNRLLDQIPSDNKTFEVCSKAMENVGCQAAMDQAALIVLARIAVEQTIHTRMDFRRMCGS
ncbi:unnamed protein product [Didymodactylos carnosus]|uniref:6-phosphogluconate dehydrogenase NADP-binding domain-containing protein n=1 Tax=Didymodactylos carnosus TaxID=1234261 RepID=A0A8S2SIX6_9BILA|nr:unnamed protein product [Didymodactylos carnosus]CAF4233016.1 unnamed protein product [Didymodactylos carnosus]